MGKKKNQGKKAASSKEQESLKKDEQVIADGPLEESKEMIIEESKDTDFVAES